MGELPWDVILGKGGPWALLALAVMGIILGRLVPSSTVKLLLQRAEDYRLAWERSEEAREVQAQQLTALLEYARTADAVLRSIPAPTSSGSP